MPVNLTGATTLRLEIVTRDTKRLQFWPSFTFIEEIEQNFDHPS